MELHTLGLVDAVGAIRDGDLDPALYRSALLRRAEAVELAIRAFTSLGGADDAFGAGRLAGAAVAIKDLIDTRDFLTSYGSPIYADHQPAEDAWIVARLKALGACVLGKTVTTEFAWREPGPTRNPRNLAHTPGGSSSGSAAAVAAGCAPLAIGTQTLGSVIRPAAFCGVVGFKPSHGTIPRDGVHPFAPSLDHVGFFARSVADADFAFSAVVADDGTSAEWTRPPRIAFVRTELWGRADQDQRDAVETAVAALRRAGATVEVAALPAGFETITQAAWTILAVEAERTFASLLNAQSGALSRHITDLVADGARTPAPAYEAAVRDQAALRDVFDEFLGGYDALLTFPAMGPAPLGLASTGDPGPCVPWTFLGTPALTLPISVNGDGLPVGLQLVGKFDNDRDLLGVARWCEEALDVRIKVAEVPLAR